MMNDPPHDDDRKWRDLADAYARGDVLEPGERRFVENHEPEDEALVLEQRLYRMMRGLGDAEHDGRGDDRTVARVLDQWVEVVDMPHHRPRRWLWMSLGGLSTAAALALVMVGTGGFERRGSRVVTLADDPEFDRPSNLESASAGVDEPSSETHPEGASPQWIAVDDGPQLEILGGGGVLDVSREETCLRRSDRARVCMRRGSKARFGDGGNLEVLAGTAEVEASLKVFEFRVAGTAIQLSEGVVEVRVEPDRWVIDVHSGRVELVDAGVSTHLGPGDELVRRAQSLASIPVGPARNHLEPAQALSRARELRRAGDPAGAAKILEALTRGQPRVSAAGTAHVLLGQIYLGSLDRPERALENFERYLVRGGSLAPEAMYGQVKALRRLGRTDEAARVADRLMAEYPNSSYAGALSGR